MGFPQSETPTNQDSVFLQTQFRFGSFVDGLSRNEENPYGVLGSDGFQLAMMFLPDFYWLYRHKHGLVSEMIPCCRRLIRLFLWITFPLCFKKRLCTCVDS
ncbi:hypothetical protein Hdeb2414_s0021g00572711 [Helianthus debilis subsp. tardiflorus]